MSSAIFIDLVHNAALLLLIVYVYDLVSSRWALFSLMAIKVPAGLALGLIGVGVMATPLDMGAGVIYDTRSVLLGIAGLFFGAVPTAIAMLMTAVFRAYLGGAGMWTGIAVIFASGTVGILWRQYRHHQPQHLGLLEYYLFGVVVQLCMLLLQLTLPEHRASLVLPQVALPVLLIFPPSMVLIAVLIRKRMQREMQTVALASSEKHLDALYRYAPVAIWKEDFSLVKQAFDQLRAQGHADLASYLDLHPQEILRLLRLIRVTDINQTGLQQMGATSLAHLQENLHVIFHEASINAFRNELVALWNGVQVYECQSIIRRLDGSERLQQVRLFVVPGHEETLDLVVVSTLDDTERQQREMQLRQGRDLLSGITDQVSGVLYQYLLRPDGSSCFPYASKGLERIYGVRPEDVVDDASAVFKYIHPDDIPLVMRTIEASVQSMKTWMCDYRVTLPGQPMRWVSGSASPTKLADGGILWHGYIRDITERKLIEQRLRLTSTVFDAAGEGVLITDAEQNIIAVNRAFSRVTGYTEAEVLGQKPSVLSSGRHDASFYRSMWSSLQEKGSWAGDIWNRRKGGEIYPEWLTLSVVKDAQGGIQYYVAVFSDLSEIRRAQNLAERMAMEDVLTGLANRAALLPRMERHLGELRGARRFSAVLMFDLDRFRDINQNLGLAHGDDILKSFAALLREHFGQEHFIARVGADEFVLMSSRKLSSREEAGRYALECFDQLRGSLLTQLQQASSGELIDISCGIVVIPGDSLDKAIDILQAADWATNRAKTEGGGRALFFAAEMGQEVRERYQLEQDLRLAIERNELRIYLQPQVNGKGEQVGAEALIRWQHPLRGLIPPGMFISLAEESNLIMALERWMLRELCRLLVRLEVAGHALKISLNISARHFEREDFVDEVTGMLRHSGVNPALLVFEVTESVVIENIGAVVDKMLELGRLGIHFSLDDFGTGYSSLSYLKRLPIQELKIDRSFITDAPNDSNDAALVETILGVARTLNLRVVAEGVETQAQADFLNAHGEVIHQGYLYDKPLPMAEWLSKYFALTS